MCRVYGFTATERTRVGCSLVEAQNALLLQSQGDRRGKTHSDGWGIGFYENGVPRIEKKAAAAYRDVLFSTTAERVSARTVVAHVRKATIGDPTFLNTQPFTAGVWTFAHNGTVRTFDRLQTLLLQHTDSDLLAHRKGQTDSELLFLWLLSRLRPYGVELQAKYPGENLDPLVDQLGRSLLLVAEAARERGGQRPSRLNVLLTDGSIFLASRFNRSLYWVKRVGVRDCEICGISHVHDENKTDYRGVAVASEPISDEAWEELPNRSVLAVDADKRATVHRMEE